METVSVTIARSGMEIRIALRRGVTRRLTMSVPSTCMASICSVTIMEPSSAVNGRPDPTGYHEGREDPAQFLDHG